LISWRFHVGVGVLEKIGKKTKIKNWREKIITKERNIFEAISSLKKLNSF
jgi:hypothetical protein